MATLGNTSIGGTGGNLTQNFEFAFGPYATTESGSIDSISIYFGSGLADSEVKLGVYRDSGGLPGDLISAADPIDSSALGWITQNSSGQLLAGNSYWVAAINNKLRATFYDASTESVRFKAKTYNDGLSDPWPTGDGSTANRNYSVYITYTPATIAITSPVAGSGMVDETTRGGTQAQNVLQITGTATGFTGPIEARFNGGSWATIATITADGAWSGELTNVPSGRGSVEVREVANTSNSASVDNFGVGYCFIITGDSNAEGRLDNPQTHGLTENKPYVFNESAEWVEMDNNDSIWVKMSALVTTRTGKPITFVWHATGGQDLSLRGTTAQKSYNPEGANYAALIALVSGSGVSSFNAALTIFGTNAAGVSPVLTPDEYATAISVFCDALRVDVNQPSLDVYLGVIGRASLTTAGNPNIRNGIATAIRRGIVKAGPNFIDQVWSDGGHPSTDAEGAFASGSWDSILAGVKPPRLRTIAKANGGKELKLRFTETLDDSVTEYDTDLFTLDVGTVFRAYRSADKEITLVIGGLVNVGYDVEGASGGDQTSNILWAIGPLTVTTAGELKSITVRDTLTSDLSLAIYEDSSGTPGALVTNFGLAAPAVDNWRTATGSYNLSAGTYWIGVNNVSGGVGLRYDSESGRHIEFRTAVTAIPDPFGASTRTPDRKYSAYFTYDSETPNPKTLTIFPGETAQGATVPIGELYTLPITIAGVSEVYQNVDPVAGYSIDSGSFFRQNILLIG